MSLAQGDQMGPPIQEKLVASQVGGNNQATRSISDRLPSHYLNQRNQSDPHSQIDLNDFEAVGDSQTTTTSPSSFDYFQSKINVTHSWLMLLVAAPLTIAILVWLLVLLIRRQRRRRLESDDQLRRQLRYKKLLINYATACESTDLVVGEAPTWPKDESGRRQPDSDNEKTNQSRYLLQLSSASPSPNSSSNSPTTTTTNSSTSTTTTKTNTSSSAVNQLINGSNRPTSGSSTSSADKRRPRQQTNHNNSLDSLISHMNNFLITLTSQQILNCFVAFSIAILNIIRMRNLFSCNLIIFLLISSRFMNLLTLASFVVTKFIRLINLRSIDSKLVSLIQQSSCESKRTLTAPNKKPNAQNSSIINVDCISEEESSSSLQQESPGNEQANNNKTVITSSPRLHSNINNERRLISSKAIKVPAGESLISNHQHQLQVGGNSERPNEPLLSMRMFLMVCMSCLIGLFCLYLRLMLNKQHQTNDWSISIYSSASAPPTTSTTSSTTSTTEATTRYDSTSWSLDAANNINSNNSESTIRNNPSDRPIFQATSWMSERSSQLRFLLDSCEFAGFFQALFDVHLSSSQFSCTFASSNYAPLARHTMLTIYATFTVVILVLSLLIKQIGWRRLELMSRLIELSGDASAWATSSSSSHPRDLHFLSESNDPKQMASSSINAEDTYSSGGLGGSRRRRQQRYSDLLKQNLRHHHLQHHQSSLEMRLTSSRSPSLVALQQQQQKHRKLPRQLKSSVSLSSLLSPPARASLKSSSSSSSRRHAHGRLLTLAEAQADQRRQGNARCAPNNKKSNRSLYASQPTHLNNQNANQFAHHLAWLPLGSASNVAASLSQIGEPTTSCRHRASSRPSTIRCQKCHLESKHFQQVKRTEELKIQVEPSRVMPGDSTGRPELINQSSSNHGQHHHHQKHEHPQRRSSKTTSSYRARPWSITGLQENNNKKNNLDGEGQQDTTTTTMTPMTLNEDKLQLELSRQQFQVYHQQQLLELKQDLHLTQVIITFAQLLHHLPVLVLLSLASFLPADDNSAALSDGFGTWTSSHDSAFVWLIILEAIALPILLATNDEKLSSALRRSLAPNQRWPRDGSKLQPPKDGTTAKLGGVAIDLPPSIGPHHKLHQEQEYCGKSQAASRLNGSGGFGHDLLLGPSSAYPDFLFAVRTSGGDGVGQPRPMSSLATGHQTRTTTGAFKQLPAASHSLTGPPYPPASNENFALVSRPNNEFDLLFGGSHAAKTIYFDELNTSTPPRRGDKLHHKCNSSLERLNSEVNVTRRGRKSCLLLDVGRQLLGRLGGAHRRRGRRARCRQVAARGRQRLGSSSCALFGTSTTTASTATTAGGDLSSLVRAARDGGASREANRFLASKRHQRDLSPTSSLSTLIRRFNHENYESVCRQYSEQRNKMDIETSHLNEEPEEEPTVSNGRESSELIDQKNQVMWLIDGLSEQGTATKTNPTDLNNNNNNKDSKLINQNQMAEDNENISCRKGGICYNYKLEENNNAGDHRRITGDVCRNSRINPMLGRPAPAGGGGRQSSCQQNLKGYDDVLKEADRFKTKQVSSSALKENFRKQATDDEGKSSSKYVVKNEPEEFPIKAYFSTDENPQTSTSLAADKLVQAAVGKTPAAKDAKELAGVVANNSDQKSVASKNANYKTPEPNISNITSVQELLDKMNGIIAIPANNPTEATTTTTNKQQSTGHEQELKASESSASGTTVANQLQQLQQLAANPATNEHRHPNRQQGNQPASLDYASLRSIDVDALSLVSVSSEFEYHDINQSHPMDVVSSSSSSGAATAIQPVAGGKRPPASCQNQSAATTGSQVAEKSNKQQATHRVDLKKTFIRSESERPKVLIKLSEVDRHSGGSTAELAKRAPDNLRFPSFLAPRVPLMGQQPGNQKSNVGVNSSANNMNNKLPQSRLRAESVSSVAQAQQSAPSGFSQRRLSQAIEPASPTTNFSSSLLNLTAAKFAVLNSSNSSAATKIAAGSSSTITKTRPAASGQAARNRSGAPPKNLIELTDATGGGSSEQQADQSPERSLPAENGNVRLRIMRMEQRQQLNDNLHLLKSTPNLSVSPGSTSNSTTATTTTTTTSSSNQLQRTSNTNHSSSHHLAATKSGIQLPLAGVQRSSPSSSFSSSSINGSSMIPVRVGARATQPSSSSQQQQQQQRQLAAARQLKLKR